MKRPPIAKHHTVWIEGYGGFEDEKEVMPMIRDAEGNLIPRGIQQGGEGGGGEEEGVTLTKSTTVFQCTKGHEWEVDDGTLRYSDRPLMLPYSDKRFCPFCLGEFLEEHIGTVEEQDGEKV